MTLKPSRWRFVFGEPDLCLTESIVLPVVWIGPFECKNLLNLFSFIHMKVDGLMVRGGIWDDLILLNTFTVITDFGWAGKMCVNVFWHAYQNTEHCACVFLCITPTSPSSQSLWPQCKSVAPKVQAITENRSAQNKKHPDWNKELSEIVSRCFEWSALGLFVNDCC